MRSFLDHDFETDRRRRRLAFSQSLRLAFLSFGRRRRRFEKRRAAELPVAPNQPLAATAARR